MDHLKPHDKRPSSQEEPVTPPPKPQQPAPSTRPRDTGQGSFGAPETDPWGSPDLHRGHNHAAAAPNEPGQNGFGSVRSATNGWANTVQVADSQNGVSSNGPANEAPPSSSGSGWDGFNNAPPAPFGNEGQSGLGGFDAPGGRDGSNSQNRAIGGGIVTGSGVEEVITVTLLPEKEGVFMFQHRNYEVKSTRRGSSVVRRYSDFVWLLDCLLRRYPFRQLPLLPPKRVAGTSKAHLRTAQDSAHL